MHNGVRLARDDEGGRRNFQVFSATEFIAAITQHIPEKLFQLVRDHVEQGITYLRACRLTFPVTTPE